MPMTAKSGPDQVTERDGVPHRRVAVAPGLVISPLSAWKIVSIPLPGSPAPKPLIEQIDDPRVELARRRSRRRGGRRCRR